MKKLIELTDGNHIEYETLLRKLATHLFVCTSYETSSNNKYFLYSELEEDYLLPEGFINERVRDNIEDALMSLYSEQVAELIYDHAGFDVTLYDNYVIDYPQDDLCIEENSNEQD